MHNSKQNVRMTKGRSQVLAVLTRSVFPIPVDAIQKQVQIDPVTVYRILDKFVLAGIATRVEFGEGKYRYELTNHHHHHVICSQCKTVADVDHIAKDDLDAVAAKKTGYKIQSHSLEFFGLCPKCQ